MQAISYIDLAKTIFKLNNETIYDTNDHLWRLKFAEYCVQEMKNVAVEEGNRKHK